MKKTSIALFALVILSSCVSKKKFVALEQEKGQITSELQKTQVEKEELEAKFAKIEARVSEYNSKINNLTEENQTKFDAVGNKAVISEKAKVGMRETLSRVSPDVMKYVTTLEDSMNMAISLNLKRFVDTTDLDESDDIAINIEETVVMISISDKMLFNSGSYKVSNKADKILKKLTILKTINLK